MKQRQQQDSLLAKVKQQQIVQIKNLLVLVVVGLEDMLQLVGHLVQVEDPHLPLLKESHFQKILLKQKTKMGM